MDQTEKRRAIAARLVAGSDQVLAGLALMEAAAREYQAAGLTFVQADFDGTIYSHLTPTIATNGIGAGAALRDWLSSSFNITNFELL